MTMIIFNHNFDATGDDDVDDDDDADDDDANDDYDVGEGACGGSSAGQEAEVSTDRKAA